MGTEVVFMGGMGVVLRILWGSVTFDGGASRLYVGIVCL